MNQFIGVGRLVKSTIKEVKDNKVCNFTIAINRSYKNANGEYETDFVNCESWGNIGESLEKYCQKGDIIGVKGSIKSDKYQDKEGNTTYRTYIRVDKITFLSQKKDNGLPEETEVPF